MNYCKICGDPIRPKSNFCQSCWKELLGYSKFMKYILRKRIRKYGLHPVCRGCQRKCHQPNYPGLYIQCFIKKKKSLAYN